MAKRPRDAHGNEADGICMGCGAAMVENRMWPWCGDCEEKDHEGEDEDD